MSNDVLNGSLRSQSRQAGRIARIEAALLALSDEVAPDRVADTA